MKRKLVIATRGSRLAIRQSEIVKEKINSLFPEISIQFLEVVTRGDIDLKTPLSAFGNTGVFVKALEEKLLTGEADLAVHSLKDVPSNHHPDLELVSFPEREDVRDVLVSASNINWRELKPGSVVGTSSPARKEQLKLLRPDLIFKDIRGNVDTRVNKVLSRDFDATILAAAGLKRLDYEIQEKTFFTLDEMIPSPGQGALVIQANKNNSEVLEILRQTNNSKVELQVKAERAFMTEIGGGCKYPVAAYSEIIGGQILFRGMAYKQEFEKLEKVKFEVSKSELVERATTEAANLISKYSKK